MPRRKKHPRFRGTLGTYKFRQALLGDPARHNRFSVLEAEATDDDSSTEPSSRMQDIEDSCGNRSTQDNSRRELVTVCHYFSLFSASSSCTYKIIICLNFSQLTTRNPLVLIVTT
jgi:hypothetical protein